MSGPEILAAIIIIALAAVLGYFISRARRQPVPPGAPPQPSDRETIRLIELAMRRDSGPGRDQFRGSARAQLERLRQELRVKVLHDEALVERLIDAERERAPNASRIDWYRAAIARWERDNE